MITHLKRVRAFLELSPNLITGYKVKYFKWTDKDGKGKQPLCVLRTSGSGASTSNMQMVDTSVQLIGLPTTIKSTDDKMEAILARVRAQKSVTGVVKFEALGTVMGPRFLENGRPVFDLNIRAYCEDQ